MHQLTTYQSEIARAIFDSVLNERGLTFTVEIAYGGGMRELSAQIEYLLLTLGLNEGANLLRIAPPGSVDTQKHVVAALQGGAPEGLWSVEQKSVRLGPSTLCFLTTEELGPSVLKHGLGLIEVADAQLVSEQVFESWIRPLSDTARVTTVLYGQPLNGETPFELTKQRNREAEGRDGVTRHFRIGYKEVASALPHFAYEVAEASARLGSEHPEFQSAYLLRPTIDGAPLLPLNRLQVLESASRLHEPRGTGQIIASVVVKRLSEANYTPVTRLFSAPIATAVITIAERCSAHGIEDGVQVVEHRWIQAVDAEQLANRVAKVLDEWQPVRTAAEDAIGHDGAFRDALTYEMGVKPIVWVGNEITSVARRLSDLLAALHTGRLTTYRFDGSAEHRALHHELMTAQISYTSGLISMSAPAGEEGFLRGLMLIVWAVAVTKRSMKFPKLALTS